MYCIYSGKELNDNEMNIEHIIPLALGGNDEFTIYVSKEKNSIIGSKIDGKFCNDTLVGFNQLGTNNKGHSKKQQKVNMRGKMGEVPITWTLSKDGSKIYDHISNKYVEKPTKMKIQFKMDIDIRIKFACKVALATGFFLFGEDFEKYADCNTLRKVIYSDKLTEEHFDLRVYDDLHKTEEKDVPQVECEKMLFEYIGKTTVLFGYAEGRIISTVAINGRYMCMVNFKADTSILPINNEEHRAGCILICDNNKLIKKSFWQAMYDMNEDLHLVDIDKEAIDIG